MQRFDLESVAETTHHHCDQMVVLICEIFFMDLGLYLTMVYLAVIAVLEEAGVKLWLFLYTKIAKS